MGSIQKGSSDDARACTGQASGLVHILTSGNQDLQNKTRYNILQPVLGQPSVNESKIIVNPKIW
jgi:hypothetical protein